MCVSLPDPLSVANISPSGIMVKFAGDKNYGGIYYLPQEALVSDLVRKAGIDDIAGFKESDLARMLHSGDR